MPKAIGECAGFPLRNGHLRGGRGAGLREAGGRLVFLCVSPEFVFKAASLQVWSGK